ncbi:MAG TPA: PD-(D/E)XK nuclease family protein, partial [bacterium (Candidatus Stahlbacteria)]|nr:PD-(D/E)XK nuclease family protein [Candidatus Stahlbacteria bacterium]
ERRFNAGKQALQRFFEKAEKEGEVPDLVEEWFSFILDDIKVMGRWDRVDMLEEGGRIIDYKTGEVTSKEAADRRAGDNIQLPIYALAYKERFGAFPKIVELHFVDTEVVGELKGLDKKVEKAKEKIREVAQKVRAREFAAKPSYMACQYCSYRGICPYKAD